VKNHPHPIREANEHLEHALHLDARRKLRVVAVVDLLKGLFVLAIGFGLLNANSHALESGGVSLLRLLDIDDGLAWSRRFLALLHAADDEKGLLVLAACAYAALRFVEAWGLWRMRNWARWLGMISAGIYVPFELYYLIRTPSWTSVLVLSINLAVLWLLWPRRPLPPPPPEASPQ
jgi:uncharacterized membrane protein (DUF2068 family)